jgi:hypothetical protein
VSRPLSRIAPAVFALLLGASVPTARADFLAVATLLGSNETPPNASTAIGFATITFEAAKDDILYTVTFSGLTVPATIAHIHVGPPGVAGPIVLPFTNMGPPSATSGTFSGTLTNADIINQATSGLTDISQIAAQIQLGNAYANIHDANFPAGEIRGQLDVVPEPASLILVSMGLAGVGSYAWRRRRDARAATA